MPKHFQITVLKIPSDSFPGFRGSRTLKPGSFYFHETSPGVITFDRVKNFTPLFKKEKNFLLLSSFLLPSPSKVINEMFNFSLR